MAFDVWLNDVGYMLQPGSYRASLETQEEAGSASTPVQRRVLASRQLLRGNATGLRSLGFWPVAAQEGAGSGVGDVHEGGWLGPGPARQAISGSIPSSEPKLPLATGSHLFVAAGTSLYRWGRVIGTAPTNRKTLPAAAACIARLRDTLWLGFGAAADVARYDDGSNVLSSSALGSGVQASLLASFNRGLALVAPDAPYSLHYVYGNALTTTRTWQLDGRIRALAPFGERLVVATDAGLHVLSGSWHQDSDPPAPPETLQLHHWATLSAHLQGSDDFDWLLVHQGRLLAWLGQQVMQFDSARGWWEPAGLTGAATLGATVSSGWLLTTIQPQAGVSRWQLWGRAPGETAGWWLLDDLSGTNHLTQPTADGAGRLVTFRAASGTLSAYDLGDTLTAATLRSPAVLTTPLLDGAELGERVTWSGVGVALARTDGQSVGSWNAAVEYSSDGGTSWHSAGAPVSVQDELAQPSWEIAVQSSTLQLRLTLTRVSGLPPAVRGLWVEHRALDGHSTARRRWQFRVQARSRSINRDGAGDGRSGQEMRSDLWELWSAAADSGSLTFRDVDHAANPQDYQVRLLALREEWPRPADAALDATTTVEVVLQEV